MQLLYMVVSAFLRMIGADICNARWTFSVLAIVCIFQGAT